MGKRYKQAIYRSGSPHASAGEKIAYFTSNQEDTNYNVKETLFHKYETGKNEKA